MHTGQITRACIHLHMQGLCTHIPPRPLSALALLTLSQGEPPCSDKSHHLPLIPITDLQRATSGRPHRARKGLHPHSCSGMVMSWGDEAGPLEHFPSPPSLRLTGWHLVCRSRLLLSSNLRLALKAGKLSLGKHLRSCCGSYFWKETPRVSGSVLGLEMVPFIQGISGIPPVCALARRKPQRCPCEALLPTSQGWGLLTLHGY